MKRGKMIFLLGAAAMLAVAMAVGAGAGVGQDAYPVGDTTVSPGSSLCIGQSMTLSGVGAPAGATLDVAMTSSAGSMMRGSQGGYAVSLGTVTADGSGNWSLTTSVPSMATVTYGGNPAEPAGSSVPVRVGSTWWIETNDYSYGGNYMSLGMLDIASCTLPSTGSGLGANGTMIVLALASAAVLAGLIIMRTRRA